MISDNCFIVILFVSETVFMLRFHVFYFSEVSLMAYIEHIFVFFNLKSLHLGQKLVIQGIL